MSIRVRLVLLFGLSAVGALAFFGYIAYDTASRHNDQRETALLHQVFKPLAARLAETIAAGQPVEPLLASWTGEYRQRLAVFITGPDGKVLHASSNYPGSAAAGNEPGPMAGTGAPAAGIDRSAIWLTFPLPPTPMTAHIGFRSDQSGTFSYLEQMRRSLIFAALIVAWLAGWTAIYISRLIERLHEQKEALRHQALHDTLTGLANRSLLCQRLTQAVSDSSRDRAPFALCFIDLNRFKEVNDTQGHLCGDKLLVVVGARLAGMVRKRDTVARLGGDEFAVVLRDADGAETRAVVDKIIRCIEEDILIDEDAYSVSCSIGIALYPQHGWDPETLLMHADIAMYSAKSDGLAWQFFEPDLLQASLLRSRPPNRPVCVLQENRA